MIDSRSAWLASSDPSTHNQRSHDRTSFWFALSDIYLNNPPAMARIVINLQGGDLGDICLSKMKDSPWNKWPGWCWRIDHQFWMVRYVRKRRDQHFIGHALFLTNRIHERWRTHDVAHEGRKRADEARCGNFKIWEQINGSESALAIGELGGIGLDPPHPWQSWKCWRCHNGRLTWNRR